MVRLYSRILFITISYYEVVREWVKKNKLDINYLCICPNNTNTDSEYPDYLIVDYRGIEIDDKDMSRVQVIAGNHPTAQTETNTNPTSDGTHTEEENPNTTASHSVLDDAQSHAKYTLRNPLDRYNSITHMASHTANLSGILLVIIATAVSAINFPSSIS